MFAQLVIGGFATGCIYAVVGLGFTLVYRTLKMVNFAQGHVFMAGAFLGLVIAERVRLPALPLLLVVGVVAFLLGMVLERFVFRRLYHNHEVFVVGSIGLGIVLMNGVRVFFPEPVPFPKVFGSEVVQIGTARFQEAYLWVVAATLVLVVLLHVMFTYTRTGRALRAVAADGEIAGAVGVNVKRSIGLTFGLSFAVAAIAGVLIGPLYFVSFDMGDMVGLKAFSAAVFGGINSIPGTIIGGIVIGILENLAGGYISSAYKDLVAFVILLLMLIWRPTGLLGRETPVKV
ncbi:MAG: branched-chain amino acid ABC transporter permease [Burkholderiales bacterium]|jgi:branched-chain amino acid transport system permease protein|nr:branched-chain amino acid ABC transporter permease [Burkholderiales bacterium]